MDADETGHVEPVIAGREGKCDQRQCADAKTEPLRRRVEQRLIGRVAFLQRTDPHQSLSISAVPNNP